MTIQQFQVGDLILCAPGPNLYKTDPEFNKPFANTIYLDYKKIMKPTELILLSKPFVASVVNDFGDRNRIELVKALWIEMNEVVFVREFDITYFFSKIGQTKG